MASVLKVDTITGVTTAGSIAVTGEGNSTTTNLQQGLAKAWAECNSAGTSINDSFNYASITDSGAGFATHNFTNAFANALFSYVGLAEVSSADAVTVIGYTTNKTTTTCRQVSYNSSNSATDQPGNSFSAHGELA